MSTLNYILLSYQRTFKTFHLPKQCDSFGFELVTALAMKSSFLGCNAMWLSLPPASAGFLFGLPFDPEVELICSSKTAGSLYIMQH
jgi:hypothetical protein